MFVDVFEDEIENVVWIVVVCVYENCGLMCDGGGSCGLVGSGYGVGVGE